MNLLNRVFHDYLDEFVIILVDDISVYSNSKVLHEKCLRKVLEILRQNMYVKFTKCDFWIKQVLFLSHITCKDGVAVDPSKVAIVTEWKKPKSVIEIISFLGFARYYKRFTKDFSTIAIPLTLLTKEDKKFT